MTAGEDGTARSVLARTVSLLSAFGDTRSVDLCLSDIARRARLPLTTAHRLCGQLVGEGLLERRPDGTYRVGLRLWELGLLAPRAHGLREAALPFLEDLYEVTHQNVQLMVLDGTEAVVVERLRARDAVPLASRAGGRLPVHATSGGLVLLAHAGGDVTDAVLSRPLQRYTSSTITAESELRAMLSLIRRQGWAEIRDHLTTGSVSVAAPVLARDRSAAAAVSVVGDGTTDVRAVVPALLTTARAITRAVNGGDTATR